MPAITRQFTFDAAHRLLGHEGKCAHIHGHTYTAEVTIRSNHLDSLGRVVDFAKVKEVLGKWIDENWDHNMILNNADPLYDAMSQLNAMGNPITSKVWADKYPYPMPIGMNPTAECMAYVLWEQASRLLQSLGVRVTRVRIYETPNCWADYEEGEVAP